MTVRSEKDHVEDTTIYIQDDAIISEHKTVPVKNLLLAMLVDRIDCFVGTYHSQSAEDRELFFEVDDWVYGVGGDEYFLSYASSCEALGIDPQKLKLGLVNVTLSKKFVWKKVDAPFEH